MKIALILGLIVSSGSLCMAAERAATPLPRSSPEAQGVSSAGLLEFVKAADQTIDAFHSVMVVRHGKVVAEGWWSPYAAETPHALYSLSKSFTSTAVGLAISEAKLSLDDEVLKFFPEDGPAEPSANLKSMRVRDLLRMSTGHQSEPALPPGQSWTKSFLAQPVPNKPGTRFLYNTPATYMLSAMVQKATGQTVLDYLTPRLFEPLGIENPTWGTSPQGVSLGGYGLSIRTEDIAKFGQLYLQKGQWNGKTLVPASWVAAATSLQTSNGSNPKSDWDQGYGYQFWRCRDDAFRGDGAFGQYCIVIPEQDAVIAITSGVKDMQAVLNLVWTKLVPAMKPAPLPADEATQKTLESTLASLSLPTPKGTSSAASGSNRTFAFPENARKLEAIALESGAKGDVDTLVIQSGGVEQKITIGRGAWRKGRLAFGMFPEQAAAASGAWTADDTYTAKIAFVETPFILTLTLKYTGDELQLQSESNVAFGPTKQPKLIGKPK